MNALGNKWRHMEVVYDKIRGLKDQGLSGKAIAAETGMSLNHVYELVTRLREIDPEFNERHPKNASTGQSVPIPKPPRGYTEKYVDDARVEINSPDTPLSVKLELLYMLGIARDPAAKGVRG